MSLRSMILLAGLFLLVYVIVYAGALIIEVVNNAGAPADYYLRVALMDVIRTLPFSTGAAAARNCIEAGDSWEVRRKISRRTAGQS